MRYRKPEVSVLGDAARVIQLTGMKSPFCVDIDAVTGIFDFCPAYDLDE